MQANVEEFHWTLVSDSVISETFCFVGINCKLHDTDFNEVAVWDNHFLFLV